MPELQYRYDANGFEPDGTLDRTLLLHLRSESLSFAVVEETQCKSLAQFRLQPDSVEEISGLYNTEPLLSATYQRTIVCMGSKRFALSPERPAQGQEHILVPNLGETALVYHANMVKEIDGCIVWGMASSMDEFMHVRFTNLSLMHSGAVILATLRPEASARVVYACVDDDSVQLAAYQNSQLQLYNMFNYQTEEDFLYFCSMIYEQLQFDMNADDLILIGAIEWNSNLVSKLRRYIRNVRLGRRAPGIVVPGSIDIKEHQEYILLSMLAGNLVHA